ncbi:MAG: hypothetical protein Q9226_003337 [Calogaya cf. arnoldii]
MPSPGNELADMTKRWDIKRASSHDREINGDTSCQSVSSCRPKDTNLRAFQTQNGEGKREGKDALAGNKTSKRLELSIDTHSQKKILDSLNQVTEDLLRTPLTPMSSPLSVELERHAYDQGLLSTGAFYRDCLLPALSVLKSPSLPDHITQHHDSSTGAYPFLGDSLASSQGQRQTENCESRPVVKRRNLSHDAQTRRIEQAPLSSIYEEPAGSQRACRCGLCSDPDPQSGRAIVWFHLCPRYAAIARKNGVTYEPWEGPIIMRHDPDMPSVGLIIEGPMEDRFIPAMRSPRSAQASEPDSVQSPQHGKVDLRAMHSANGRPARTTSGPKLHQLSPISTPALQRPISPTTQVSYPTLLNPLYSVYSPKHGEYDWARDAAPTSQGIIEQFPTAPSANPQLNVHPAFRTRATLPEDQPCSPSRNHPHNSIEDEKFERPSTPEPESLRRSSNYSDFSEWRPMRKDSLGAPSHCGLREDEVEGKSSIDHSLKTGRVPKHSRARNLALSSSTASVLSPSASHERTPSVFLGPSTPSTASFLRSSMSSYGEPWPSQNHGLEAGVTPVNAEGKALASPFQSRHHSVISATDADSCTPRRSYVTAPNSHYAYSPPLKTPQTPHTSISSLDRLRSNSSRQNSPFFESQGYLRCRASEHSFAQKLGGLQIQEDDGMTSSTNLLNGTAFDNADSNSEDDSTDPLETVGATEAHCTNIVTSGNRPKQQSIINAGFRSSNSTLTLKPTPKSPSPIPHPGLSATNEENYLRNKISINTAQQRHREPLRRSLIVQQNLCSHTKLQHMLGIEPSSASMTGNHRSRSQYNAQSPSMTMNEVLSPMRKENDRLGFVKKGSLLFREKRSDWTEKVKAGWKVRPEEWQDDDDRN